MILTFPFELLEATFYSLYDQEQAKLEEPQEPGKGQCVPQYGTLPSRAKDRRECVPQY